MKLKREKRETFKRKNTVQKNTLSRGPDFELQANKHLGQHFLRDESVLDGIVDAANAICTQKGVPRICIEIGPGEGVLTRKLLAAGWTVQALEKDVRSVEGLTQTLQKEFPNTLTIVQTDILMWDPKHCAPGTVCLGNVPYYITSDILLWFSKHAEFFSGGLFMVQKEVADRIPSPSGTKNYGRLSVRMQLMFACQCLFVVPATAFAPPPKVDSAVISMLPTGFKFANALEDRAFDRLTATLFSARRKMLRRGLASTIDSFCRGDFKKEEFLWNELKKIAVFPETRPDAIPPQAILALHRLLLQMQN